MRNLTNLMTTQQTRPGQGMGLGLGGGSGFGGPQGALIKQQQQQQQSIQVKCSVPLIFTSAGGLI